MEGIPVGTHCILELYGCPFELLNDAEFIRRSLRRASKQGLSTLLGLRSHKFEPQGVTAVALLAESHISIHTWPETGYAAVDIFTCGETAQPQLACDFMVENFAAREHAMCILPRGAGLSETTPSWTRETTTGAELCPAQS